MKQFMELQSRNFSVLSLKCCYDDMVGGIALFSTHLFPQKSATNLLTTNLIRGGTERVEGASTFSRVWVIG